MRHGFPRDCEEMDRFVKECFSKVLFNISNVINPHKNL